MNSLIYAGLITSMLSTPAVGITNGVATNSGVVPTTSINQNMKKSYVSVKTEKMTENNSQIETSLEIPVIKGLLDFQLQEKINNMFKNDITNFNKDLVKKANVAQIDAQKYGYEALPYGCVTSFKVCNNTSNLLSIYVDFYQFTGGAHGTTTRKAYNIDLKTGKLLTLKDITKNKSCKDLIDKKIKSEMNKNPEIYFSDTFEGITDNQTFYVEGDKLIICFQQYDIECYAAGMPEFTMLLSNF